MLKHLLGTLSPAGPRARLSILIFHRVLAVEDPLFPDEIDAARFDRICGWLREWFNVLPLDSAVQRLRDGRLPARAACITFDDGYADNHRVALPILRRHGLSATFFIATGFLDGGRMFNDSVIEIVRRTAGQSLRVDSLGIGDLGHLDLRDTAARQKAIVSILMAIKYRPPDEREALTRVLQVAACVDRLPDDLMMSSDHVRALHRAGMQIGAHTMSHPILARLDDGAARAEIQAGKQALEDLLGQRVGMFAYPNGKPGEDYSMATVRLARDAGFDAAVSTAWGAAAASSDPFQLPRFTPWDRTAWRFGLRLARNLLGNSSVGAT
jgi:peptidoglycan/xylan/chitin deacetylase (PgdA/CDA1 family)